ncbi:MAG: hypothetical protein SWQ30_14350 [Thermodesulfobacteriota bacterium]|nr:hypothetical protein [Thermodesulfobacteriota bacterium]
MWIEVFKTGTHTASNGKTMTVSEADLDRIANQYNPKHHEAPVVIGHPKEADPAYGWVERLKRSGSTLLAKLKDLVPEFVELVKKGLYKKRSISLFPDLTLKHVGFLGATPPAVKGLADVRFMEFKDGGNTMTFTFSEKTDPGAEIDRLAKAKMKEEEGFEYRDALNEVVFENPELARQWPPTAAWTEAHSFSEKDDDPGEELARLTRAKMKGDKSLNYCDALNEVIFENPDIAKRYPPIARLNL